jgi:HEAT repeat protein
MKNTLRAVAFCSVLLLALSGYLWQSAEAAKEDVVVRLLSLPAPPPPNPAVQSTAARDDKFYNRAKPPADNAPIGDLVAYWTSMSESFSEQQYTPEPTAAVLSRLKKEIDKDPKKLVSMLNIFTRDEDGGAYVKGHYDSQGTTGVYDRDERLAIRRWLSFHSSYFPDDLIREAESVTDTSDNYVSNQTELLALTRHNFSRAKPILDRLYSDTSRPVSRTLAIWALYRNAIATDSTGDIERYRDELKAIVENKQLGDGMRDLAMDALVVEKEWSGRDDWYYSLMSDETLVNMPRFTGMTTLINLSHPEKYVEKMIELLKSDDATVRGGAIRNLARRFDSENVELIRALIPWLENPKWAVDAQGTRARLVEALASVNMPEAVPGLISLLEEKSKRAVPTMRSDVNGNAAVTNSYNTAANAAAAVANAVSSVMTSATFLDEEVSLRMPAVRALAKQKDPRAIAGLRRVLSEVQGYERTEVVGALLASGGFSIGEQMDALEAKAKGVADAAAASYANSSLGANHPAPVEPYIYSNTNAPSNRPISGAEIKAILGDRLVAAEEISDGLARALVDKIEALDKSNPSLSAAYRQMALGWQSAVINSLLLRDIKNDRSSLDGALKVLAQRKALRENQSSDAASLANGTPTSRGFLPCIFEDAGGYEAVLDGDAKTKAAMLACARMIRAKLPIAKVAELLTSDDKLLALAAERYLESEDSPEARAIVLARHPNEAKVLGARTAFFVDGATGTESMQMWALFASIDGADSVQYGGVDFDDEHLQKIEKSLRDEVKKDASLLGVYGYDRNYVRLYGDRIIFSWDEDDSRYRERQLRPDEFDELKNYLTDNRVDELPPFLACDGEHCESKELVMVGRAGGRRVFMTGDGGDFFAGLDKIFATYKQAPAAVKYAISREFPGVELILADDNKYVETVWKTNGNLIVAVTDRAAQQKLGDEIEESALNESEAKDNQESKAAFDSKRAELADRYRYDSIGWYSVADGMLGIGVPQPAGLELIPARDGLQVPATAESWKARASGFEIRVGTGESGGVFKVAGGRMTRVAAGNFSSSAVVTPNARWAVVAGYSAEYAPQLARVDLVSGRVFTLKMEDYRQPQPVAAIGNKVLVRLTYGEDHHEEDYSDVPEDAVVDDAYPDTLFIFDPATGVLLPAVGEFRPLAQTTFRQLQPRGRPNEFWAAILGEDGETRVGTYETRAYTFKPVATLPKISFNSMKMYVDEAANKVYFVYRGHLLAVPLRRAS